jgi:hypothetical protein
MKTIAYASIFVLFLLSLATPGSTSARVSGPTASGTYRFAMEDGLTKQIEFNATTDERGTTTGQMTFQDEARIVDQQEESSGDAPAGEQFYMTARLDSLKIEHNRAVMGGTVTASSHRSYIGKFLQLVAEDNGDGREAPDQVSWSFCQPEPGGWTPADAEVRDDEGAWWHWWATDAELRDDAGVPSQNIIPGNSTGCPLLPLATYSFAEVRSAEGNIQILP